MKARRLLPLALALLVSGGCLATRQDVTELRTELQVARAAQDSLLRVLRDEIRGDIRRQSELVMDTLNVQDMRLRGDLRNRMVQIERQLIQIQELTGQGQQRLAELRQELRSQEEALRAAAAAAPAATGGEPPAGEPGELMESAAAALERGSFSTARAAYEEFIRAYPQHAQAPMARLGIGESYDKAKEPANALQAYQRVLELHPNSPQAATALYSSALIEIGRKNNARARTLLNQLTTAYPRSPEAPRAKEQLTKLK